MRVSSTWSSILALVRAAEESGAAPNRTQIQKSAFFAKSYGLLPDLPYRFVLHHFGPYSFGLDHELIAMEAFRALRVEHDPSGFGARYSVPDEYEAQAASSGSNLRPLSEWLSQKTTKQLEALATCEYFYEKTREDPVQRVLEVKPHLTEPEVRAAWEELAEKRDLLRASRTSSSGR